MWEKIDLKFFKVLVVLMVIVQSILFCSNATAAGPIIVDHTCTDLREIPISAIEQAKETLHIAYGHTSHGSQLISGMGDSGTQLDAFLNGSSNYQTYTYPGLHVWHDGPQAGALDLDNKFVGGDLGNPNRTTWAARTRTYLDNPANSDVNVIIWSWCGQANTSTGNIDIYLNLMEGLIADYPDVHFVFMTGHLTGSGAGGTLNLANEHIRNHCITNERILYDFADIESYDPDRLINYMELLANDNCDYDSDGNGSRDKNWASDWQGSHTQDTDWWASGAAHSQNLNGNLKGYAAWWLWARLAGWGECLPAPSGLTAAPDSINQQVVLTWMDNSSDINEDSFIIQRRIDSGAWDDDYITVAANTTIYADYGLGAASYDYRVVAHLDDDGSGNPCDSGASNIASAEIMSAESPEAPTDLALIADSQDRIIELAWTDNSGNETGFIIQRQVNGETWTNDYAATGENETAYDDQNLLPGVYNYRVVACNDFGNSEPSNEAVDTILDLPFAPGNLQATGDSPAGTVLLAWTDNSGNETDFIIQRQVNGGTWDNNYAAVGVNSTSYLDNNGGSPPLPNATYNYRVAAFNGDGESNPSNEDAAVISQEVPDDPSDLESSLNGFDITLTWIDKSDNEENFILERKIDGGSFIILDDTLPANTETYLDSGLQPLSTYAYRVKAQNNYGDSGYSNETSEYIAEESYTIILKQSVDGYAGCRDAYLDSAYPSYNYGGDRYNYVENNPKCNFAIAFDLPSEVADKRILEATIGFYCWSVSSWQEDQYLDLYRLTEEWEEGTADGSYQVGSSSWNVRGDGSGNIAWTTPGGTHDSALLDSSLIPSSGYYPEFDITDLVQEWVDGTVLNNGVLLKNDTPTRTGIKASEYSEYGRPYLKITYTNKPPCPTDLDEDGDVDGSDLAAFAADFNENCIDEFAADYGQ